MIAIFESEHKQLLQKNNEEQQDELEYFVSTTHNKRQLLTNKEKFDKQFNISNHIPINVWKPEHLIFESFKNLSRSKQKEIIDQMNFANLDHLQRSELVKVFLEWITEEKKESQLEEILLSYLKNKKEENV